MNRCEEQTDHKNDHIHVPYTVPWCADPPLAATNSKSGNTALHFDPAQTQGACVVIERWATRRWTCIPNLVTLSVLHVLCRWDRFAELRTDKEGDKWMIRSLDADVITFWDSNMGQFIMVHSIIKWPPVRIPKGIRIDMYMPLAIEQIVFFLNWAVIAWSVIYI